VRLVRGRPTAALLALACGCASGAGPSASQAGRAAGGDGFARVALRCADGSAEVSVDGAPAGRVSDYAGHRLRVRPGRHRIEVRGQGAVEVREMELGPEDDVALAIALRAPAPARVPGGSQ
jgi:hypothetical protein